MGSGFSVKFTDFKENEFHKFSKKAPKWRIVGKGLNFFGICKCKFCEAGKNQNEVICHLNIKENKEFNFLEDKDKIQCPICESIINTKTVGFFKCKISVNGDYLPKNEKITINFSKLFSVNQNDGLIVFKSDKDHLVNWVKLIFKINEFYD